MSPWSIYYSRKSRRLEVYTIWPCWQPRKPDPNLKCRLHRRQQQLNLAACCTWWQRLVQLPREFSLQQFHCLQRNVSLSYSSALSLLCLWTRRPIFRRALRTFPWCSDLSLWQCRGFDSLLWLRPRIIGRCRGPLRRPLGHRRDGRSRRSSSLCSTDQRWVRIFGFRPFSYRIKLAPLGLL